MMVVGLQRRQINRSFNCCTRLTTRAQASLTVRVTSPTTLPLFLVFPIFQVAGTQFNFSIIGPYMLRTFTSNPSIFANRQANVTTSAFVRIGRRTSLQACFRFFTSYA